MRARVCMRVSMCARVSVRVRVSVCVCVRVRMHVAGGTLQPPDLQSAWLAESLRHAGVTARDQVSLLSDRS